MFDIFLGTSPFLVSISVLWFQFLSTSVTFLEFPHELTHSASSSPRSALYPRRRSGLGHIVLYLSFCHSCQECDSLADRSSPRPTDRPTACWASQLTVLAAFHSASSSRVWRKQYDCSLNLKTFLRWVDAAKLFACHVEAAVLNDRSYTRGLL